MGGQREAWLPLSYWRRPLAFSFNAMLPAISEISCPTLED
jgi:hypothetical protein